MLSTSRVCAACLVRGRRVRLRSGVSSGRGGSRGFRASNSLRWLGCYRRPNNNLGFHNRRFMLLRSSRNWSHLNWLGLWRLNDLRKRRRSSSTVGGYALRRNQTRLRRGGSRSIGGGPAMSMSMRGRGLRNDGLGRSNRRLWCSNLGGLDRMRTSGRRSRRVLFLFENSFQSVTGFGDL